MLPLTNRQVQLMGTTIDTSIYHANPQPILDQVEELLHLYNHRFSANDDTSELMAINQAAGKKAVSVHPQLFDLIALGKKHSLAPGSHLNIAIGPLIQTWRIGFADAKVPSQEEIEAQLDLIDP
ncbi:FAD:protein FMN transferase, partial [Streptococcus sobrinus]